MLRMIESLLNLPKIADWVYPKCQFQVCNLYLMKNTVVRTTRRKKHGDIKIALTLCSQSVDLRPEKRRLSGFSHDPHLGLVRTLCERFHVEPIFSLLPPYLLPFEG